MKPIWITAKQYFWDQLDKHIVTDPLEDILKQLEKQIHSSHTHTQGKQLKCTEHGTHTSNTLHESMTTNNREDISQTNREVNNGQKVSVNNVPFLKNAEMNSQGE